MGYTIDKTTSDNSSTGVPLRNIIYRNILKQISHEKSGQTKGSLGWGHNTNKAVVTQSAWGSIPSVHPCNSSMPQRLCGILACSVRHRLSDNLFISYLTLKAPPIIRSRRQILRHLSQFSTKIRCDITWESSASRRFSWNLMPYLLFLKKRQNI